jgi:hypothetical protein
MVNIGFALVIINAVASSITLRLQAGVSATFAFPYAGPHGLAMYSAPCNEGKLTKGEINEKAYCLGMSFDCACFWLLFINGFLGRL